MRIRSIRLLLSTGEIKFILTREDNSVWQTKLGNLKTGANINIYPDGILPPWGEEEKEEKEEEKDIPWGRDLPLEMIPNPEEFPTEELLARAGYSDEEIQAYLDSSREEAEREAEEVLTRIPETNPENLDPGCPTDLVYEPTQDEVEEYIKNKISTPPSPDDIEKAQLQENLKDET